MALQAWTGQTAGQTDADSPIDQTLMDSYRTDLVHLKQNVYGDGAGGFKTAVDGHTHNNVNSVRSVVDTASLKTSYNSVSTTGDINFTFGSGEYFFYPLIKGNITEAKISIAQNYGTLGCQIHVKNAAAATIEAKSRFVQASSKDPWVFILYDNVKKEIITVWESPEHPSWQSGIDPMEWSHPFIEYEEMPLPSNLDIIVAENSVFHEARELANSQITPARIIMDNYKIDFNSNPVFIEREIIGIDEYGDQGGEIIERIDERRTKKKQIVETLPSFIQYRNLIKK